MEWLFSSILVSVIQGITEFLPVSSSGHLVLLPALTGLEDQGQVMDVAAHAGTFFAVFYYLRADIWQIFISLPTFFRAGTTSAHHLSIAILVASLPAIAVGVIIEILSPSFLRLALTVALANLVFAGWLWFADKTMVSKQLGDTDQLDWHKLPLRDALYIGIAQCFALIPGASRSGVTMTMARQLGYDRLVAARFSLLLSLPVIAGAGAVKLVGILTASSPIALEPLAAVILLSFLFALAAIKWMMGWLKHANFSIFIYYRIALGVVLLALIGTGIIT